MRHNKAFNHLGRKTGHRKAMLSNMASSLIMHKRINTTLAKAKALKVFVEPLITRAKEDTTHNRRVVFRSLQDKNAVSELFRQVAVKVGDRPGGYTRILKTGYRLGDNAEMCIIELVDYNENMLNLTETTTKKKRTRRGGSSSTSEPKEIAKSKSEAKAEKENLTKEEVKTEEVAEAKVVDEVKEDEKTEVPETETLEETTPKAEEPKNDDSEVEDKPEEKK
jgi:large subunit ribosomal protein L17